LDRVRKAERVRGSGRRGLKGDCSDLGLLGYLHSTFCLLKRKEEEERKGKGKGGEGGKIWRLLCCGGGDDDEGNMTCRIWGWTSLISFLAQPFFPPPAFLPSFLPPSALPFSKKAP